MNIHQRRLFITNIYSILIAIVFSIFYGFYQFNFDSSDLDMILKTLSILIIFLIVPDVIQKHFNWQYHGFTTVLVVLGFAFTGFFIALQSLLLIIVALALMIYYHAISFRLFVNGKKGLQLFKMLFGVIVSILLGGVLFDHFYFNGYHHPLLFEKIVTGNAHIDTLFHTAISNLFKNYYIPSTGLNGLVHVPYHYGSHLIFAGLSNLISVKPIDIYNFSYPVIFIPLFFKSFVLLFYRICEKYAIKLSVIFTFLILIASITILYPLAFNTVSPFGSESYALSLTFCFLFLIDLFHKLHEPLGLNSKLKTKLLIYFTVASVIILFLKVSTGIVFIAIIGWVALRFLSIKDRYFLAYVLAQVLVIIMYYFFFLSKGNKSDLQLLSAQNWNWVRMAFFNLLFAMKYHGWLFFFLAVFYLYYRRQRGFTKGPLLKAWWQSKQHILLEVYVVAAIAGLLPAMFIPGLNASDKFYFTAPQFYFGSLLGFALILKVVPDKWRTLDHVEARILLITLLCYFAFYQAGDIIQVRNKINNERSDIRNEFEERPKYVKFLNAIAQYADEKDVIFYTPKSNEAYWTWQLYRPNSIYFLIPAISGKPQLNAIPDQNYRGYSFSRYPFTLFSNDMDEDDFLLIAKSMGFERLIVVGNDLTLRIVE